MRMEVERQKWMVKYYSTISTSEQSMMYKMFEEQKDAYEFMTKLGDRFVEMTEIRKPKGYPDAELDLL